MLEVDTRRLRESWEKLSGIHENIEASVTPNGKKNYVFLAVLILLD